MQLKGKENENCRLEKKIKRMLAEGYVDKMIVPNYHLHDNNQSRRQKREIAHTIGTDDEQEANQQSYEEEDEDFYPSNDEINVKDHY